MFGYKRLDSTFEIIRHSSHTPAERLAGLFGVTARTVRSDISKMNAMLAGSGARIIMRRGAGYRLSVVDAERFERFSRTAQTDREGAPDLSGAAGRMRFLLFHLLRASDYRSYDELADAVCVGENTLQSYIRQIKDLLAGYDLALLVRAGIGARVIGREADKRRCYMDHLIDRNMRSYVKGFSQEERGLFPAIDLARLEQIVHAHLARSALVSTDYGFKNLLVHAALMISRIEQGFELEMGPPAGVEPRIGRFVDDACDDLELACGISINQAERQYLHLHTLSNTSPREHRAERHPLPGDIEAMLAIVFRNYGFDLRDNIALKRNLLAHLSATFRGKELRVVKRNPLLNTIRTNFPLAFEIALVSTLKIFDTEPYTLSEDEVGYIALHLGAAIERKAARVRERDRIILVCGASNSIAQMLKSRIETLFGDKLEIVSIISYQRFRNLGEREFARVSFVISTVPFEACPVPSVLVDFTLTGQDTEAVSRLLNTVDTGRDSRVGMFFDPALFERGEGARTKRDVLERLCQRLVEHRAVGGEFLASVLEREELSETSMNPVFAIPHAMKPIGRTTSVAVAILRDGVPWNDEAPQVRIVFLLAVRAGDRINIEHLYDLLLEITNSKRMQHEILSATTFDAFMAALSHQTA